MDPIKDLSVRYCSALAEAIRALGVVKEGHLYAFSMKHMSLPTFNACIDVLVTAKLVRRGANYDLHWIGDSVIKGASK